MCEEVNVARTVKCFEGPICLEKHLMNIVHSQTKYTVYAVKLF